LNVSFVGNLKAFQLEAVVEDWLFARSRWFASQMPCGVPARPFVA
jgi:hypothetical protein